MSKHPASSHFTFHVSISNNFCIQLVCNQNVSLTQHLKPRREIIYVTHNTYSTGYRLSES